MKCGDLIFSHGHSIISRAIEWYTHSHWSHVRIAISDKEFIEATWPKVRIGNMSEVKEESNVRTPIIPLTQEEQFKLRLFLQSKLGKKYDWRGLLSFLIRKNVQNKNWFYCNELAEEAYIYIGKKLVGGNPSWHEPQHTYDSLLLKDG